MNYAEEGFVVYPCALCGTGISRSVFTVRALRAKKAHVRPIADYCESCIIIHDSMTVKEKRRIFDHAVGG